MKSSRVLIAGVLGGSLVGCGGARLKADPLPLASPANVPQRALRPVSTPATQAQPPVAAPAPADPFAAALTAFDAGKLDVAADLFRAALHLNPKSVRAQHDLGVVAWRKNDLVGAEQSFRAALKIDPTFAPSLLQLAKLYRATDRLDAEVALLEGARARSTAPQDPAVELELATAYRQEKNFVQAEATCRRVLARSNDDVAALETLARIELDQGNGRLAGFIAAKAARLDPKSARIHNDLALIALRLGKTPLAVAELQKAVALDPDFEPAHFNLGAIALRYRDYQGAEDALARATALAPADVHAHLALAWALDGERAQNPAKAALAGAEYENVLALQPTSSAALCGAAWAYAADRSGWNKAKSFLERCRDAPDTAAGEKQRIDAKLQSIAMAQTSLPAPGTSSSAMGGSGVHGPSAADAPGGTAVPVAPAATDPVGASPAQAGESAATPAPVNSDGSPAPRGESAASPANTAAPATSHASGARSAPPPTGTGAAPVPASPAPGPARAPGDAVQQTAATPAPRADVTPVLAPAAVGQTTPTGMSEAAAGPDSAEPRTRASGSAGTVPSSKP